MRHFSRPRLLSSNSKPSRNSVTALLSFVSSTEIEIVVEPDAILGASESSAIAFSKAVVFCISQMPHVPEEASWDAVLETFESEVADSDLYHGHGVASSFSFWNLKRN